MHRWFFGKVPKIPAPGLEGSFLHVGSQIQRTVVFLGHEDPNSRGGIQCQGTGFLLNYKNSNYLITVRHIAKNLGKDPFVIRLNRRGSAELVCQDFVEWFYPEDDTVDLAITPLDLETAHGYECLYLPEGMLVSHEKLETYGIDIGELTYTLGLFHYFYGNRMNYPVLHSGNISLMPPSGERIPIWDDGKKKEELVEGYLIESRAINGASGSPVFVRPGFLYKEMFPAAFSRTKKSRDGCIPDGEIFLLGLYQGAWFAPPDPNTTPPVTTNKKDIVPVGIGVVVPAIKIIELLERGDMANIRDSKPRAIFAKTAVQQGNEPTVDGGAPEDVPESADLEGFNRLLGAAVKQPKSSDGT